LPGRSAKADKAKLYPESERLSECRMRDDVSIASFGIDFPIRFNRVHLYNYLSWKQQFGN